MSDGIGLNRRAMLGLLAGGAAVASLGSRPARAAMGPTSARSVILGAGAASSTTMC